eukprot:TRINITY_DN63880_c0_g1_i1.p1 TRINITY_DN63880_c0_g1~~TRINITY_DN63880_c0_g1_i1.p1  ORF type:complete len:344 (+),score=-94.32 TRINITY_DN63880_c0_g1_i1:1000-2031(+)
MSRVTSSLGLRVGYNKSWKSAWVSSKNYGEDLKIDLAVRDYLKSRLGSLSIIYNNFRVFFSEGVFFVHFDVIEFFDKQEEPEAPRKKPKKGQKDFTYRPKKKKKTLRERIDAILEKKEKKKKLTAEELLLLMNLKKSAVRKLKILQYKMLQDILEEELGRLIPSKIFKIRVSPVFLNYKGNKKEQRALIDHFDKTYEDRLEIATFSSRGFLPAIYSRLIVLSILLNNPTFASRSIAEAISVSEKQTDVTKALVHLLKSFIHLNPKLSGIKIKIKGRFNKSKRSRAVVIEVGESVSMNFLDGLVLNSSTPAITAIGTFNITVWFYSSPTGPISLLVGKDALTLQ